MAERDGPDFKPDFNHPHAAFHYGLAQYYRAKGRGRDVGELLLDLSAYVAAMCEEDDPFHDAWEALEAQSPDDRMSTTGAGSGLTWPALRALQLQLLLRTARRLRMFEPVDHSFGRDQLEQKKARVGGGR